MIDMLVVIFSLYVIPMVLAYKGVQSLYRDSEVRLRPGLPEVLVVLLPLLNLGMAVFYLIHLFFTIGYKLMDKLSQKGNKQLISKFFRLEDD